MARVILVTDPAFGDDRIERCIRVIAKVLPEGWLCVQIRDKVRFPASLRLFASRLRVVTRASGARLVINGDPRIARDVGADGVHLGGGAGSVADARVICGATAWVSVAAHSDDDVRSAVADGADAALVSPVFATEATSGAQSAPARKQGRGLQAIGSARAVASGRVALYALGGVTAERARACIHAGADGIALKRALLASDAPARVARALHDAVA